VLRRNRRESRHVGRIGGRGRDREGAGGLAHRAHEALEAGRLDDQEEAGALGGDLERVGTFRGPKTKEPAGAAMTRPPAQKVSSPSVT
jgi:hypothetical protein